MSRHSLRSLNLNRHTTSEAGSFFVCYMAVGLSGFALFNSDSGGIKGEMSLNFDSRPIFAVAATLYSIQLIPTYAVVYFVTYESVEGKFARWLGATRENQLEVIHLLMLYAPFVD